MASANNETTTFTEPPDIRPFEWLTSPASLEILIRQYVLNRRHEEKSNADLVSQVTTDAENDVHDDASTQQLHALHVGCGSSTVGEFLVQDLGFAKVVNVDRDENIMTQMQRRWQETVIEHNGKDDNVASSMEFLTLDFTKQRLPEQYNDSFHLVLDKSTLDCTLCSDIATASLLLEVYRTLKQDGGVYLVISFHDLELLLPLLQDLPGAEWDVEHTTMARQVEQLHVNGGTNKSSPAAVVSPGAVVSDTDAPLTARKPLNVLICRRHVGTAHDQPNDT
ncbi:MAG: hypothetical protein SGARI_005292, partial [Bacillariaceae sp.]